MKRKSTIDKKSDLSSPKIAIIIFIAIACIVPFLQSQKIISWENEVRTNDNIFHSLILWYASASEIAKYEINSGNNFQKDNSDSSEDTKVKKNNIIKVGPETEEIPLEELRQKSEEVPVVADEEGLGVPQILANNRGIGRMLSVLLIGDSFLGHRDGIGATLEKEILSRYKNRNLVIYRIIKLGTGLGTDDKFDFWTSTCEKIFSQYEIDAVIIHFSLIDSQRQTHWKEIYAWKVTGLLDLFDKHGVKTFWVGAPNMKKENHAIGPREINSIIKREVENYEDAYFIDTWPLFTDEEGKYTAFLLTEEGYRKARSQDGMHYLNVGSKAVVEKIIGMMEKVI